MGRRLTDLRFTHAFVDRTGAREVLFSAAWKTYGVARVPGSREFMDAYATCLAEQPLPWEPRLAAPPRRVANILKKIDNSIR